MNKMYALGEMAKKAGDISYMKILKNYVVTMEQCVDKLVPYYNNKYSLYLEARLFSLNTILT